MRYVRPSLTLLILACIAVTSLTLPSAEAKPGSLTVGCFCRFSFSDFTPPTLGVSGQEQFSIKGGRGFASVEGVRVAEVRTLDVDLLGVRDPMNPLRVVASVTSAQSQVGSAVVGGRDFGQTLWTLGKATPSCDNVVVFDNREGSMLGCVVLDVEGGFASAAIELELDGKYAPPPSRDGKLSVVGATNNFDLSILGLGK